MTNESYLIKKINFITPTPFVPVKGLPLEDIIFAIIVSGARLKKKQMLSLNKCK